MIEPVDPVVEAARCRNLWAAVLLNELDTLRRGAAAAVGGGEGERAAAMNQSRSFLAARSGPWRDARAAICDAAGILPEALDRHVANLLGEAAPAPAAPPASPPTASRQPVAPRVQALVATLCSGPLDGLDRHELAAAIGSSVKAAEHLVRCARQSGYRIEARRPKFVLVDRDAG